MVSGRRPAHSALFLVVATSAMGACGTGEASTTGATVPPASDAGTAVACIVGHQCTTSHCALTVPASTTVPTGLAITVDEFNIPAALASDVIEQYGCVVAVPEGTSLPAPLRLGITMGASHPDAVTFRFDDDGAAAIAASVVTGFTAEALVSVGGRYGLTARRTGWKLSETIANDPLASGNLADLVRNLSLQTMNAAWYDGHRLYLGDGPRTLIWNGIPSNPTQRPDLVVGQPNLDTIAAGISQAVFVGTVGGIWADESRLALTEANRLLVWNRIPDADLTPADLVLGQQDFVSIAANIGGVSATTLSSPRGITSNGTKLSVADLGNSRVLTWDTFPTRIGEPATSVLGQASFSTTDTSVLNQPFGVAASADGLFVATGITGVKHFGSTATGTASDFAAIDPSYPLKIQRGTLQGATSVAVLPGGGLAMTSSQVSRIALQRTTPSDATPADYVLGQPDPDRTIASTVSASTVSSNARFVSANGAFLVPDGARLLVYDHRPAFNFDPADRAIGQAGFTVNDRGTDYRHISERTLAYPSDVASNGTIIAVTDTGNNRVVLYPAASPGANAAAAVVLGQADTTSFIANVDQQSASARTLSGPEGVALDADRLIVADTENHRVLVWSPVPTASGAPANVVLGQADFTSHRPNRGNLDADADGYSDATAGGLFYPTGVASDGTHLFVADRVNNRVLVWDDLAHIANGRAADRVLGQSSFSSVVANRGQGASPRADGFSFPTGIALEGTSLWVADTENNRVVRWDSATSSGMPTVVLGQANGSSLTNPNAYPQGDANAGFPIVQSPTATTLLRPRSVASANGTVIVSERDANRVHLYTGAGTSFASAGLIGQSSPTSGNANAPGLGRSSLASPQGVALTSDGFFVADTANHRVLRFAGMPTSASLAAGVFGQTSFVANGFNQALSATAGASTRPAGMSISGGQLFVAERGRNRIVVHQLPLVPGREPARILGQQDASAALPNGGGSASASTLSGPSAVFADEQRVIVADTDNNRVLLYSRVDGIATVVLGQADFASSAPNRGAGPNVDTLNHPGAIFTDGVRLLVTDTGNHRVLFWSAIPTTSGQPADLVIGQATFSANAPNGGAGVADARTLASPGAAILVGDGLYIADSGNNRVLVFDSVPTAAGAAASRVIGQPTFTTRVPASSALDPTLLSGPVALASDGTNLYVADRDSNRIVGFTLAGLATGGAASILLSGSTGLSSLGPSGLAVERTALFTSRLYIADTNRDQLLVVDGVPRIVEE